MVRLTKIFIGLSYRLRKNRQRCACLFGDMPDPVLKAWIEGKKHFKLFTAATDRFGDWLEKLKPDPVGAVQFLKS